MEMPGNAQLYMVVGRKAAMEGLMECGDNVEGQLCWLAARATHASESAASSAPAAAGRRDICRRRHRPHTWPAGTPSTSPSGGIFTEIKAGAARKPGSSRRADDTHLRTHGPRQTRAAAPGILGNFHVRGARVFVLRALKIKTGKGG